MVEDALTRKQLGPEFARRIQLADATILFADIAGSIDVLGHLPSEEALARLYECMGEIVQSVLDHGGTLHLYEGEVSRAGEFHPYALPEPYVSLSTHTAPINQPSASPPGAASERTGSADAGRFAPANAPPAGDAP